jgi:hypothetical protein
MKVERARAESLGSAAREPSAGDARLSAALAESFNVALRRYRPQTSSGAEESRRRTADRSASSRSTERREERARQTNSSEADTPNPAPTQTPVPTPDNAPEGCACTPLDSLMRGADPGAAVPVSARPGAETRKARRSGAVETPRCIEVVDPRTGMRFVLSREGEVWLLSVQSQTTPSPADLDSLVATLRGQFSDRGLGAIDIVLA